MSRPARKSSSSPVRECSLPAHAIRNMSNCTVETRLRTPTIKRHHFEECRQNDDSLVTNIEHCAHGEQLACKSGDAAAASSPDALQPFQCCSSCRSEPIKNARLVALSGYSSRKPCTLSPTIRFYHPSLLGNTACKSAREKCRAPSSLSHTFTGLDALRLSAGILALQRTALDSSVSFPWRSASCSASYQIEMKLQKGFAGISKHMTSVLNQVELY